ncbi:hypothetical protein ACFQO7_34395 [Catellatospora aurea]|uniref:Uncharacterized protein n=1 Tax=Catellatospora aurea TaxID=1337874 RepID=A0ABW2HA78_9ACTN
MGDTVALADGNGVVVATTEMGWPIVEVTAGQRLGKRVCVRPSDVLSLIAHTTGNPRATGEQARVTTTSDTHSRRLGHAVTRATRTR